MTSILNKAEEISGETGWARQETANCIDQAEGFRLDEFFNQDMLLWWKIGAAKRAFEPLNQLTQLRGVPWREDTNQLMREYLCAALDQLDAQPEWNEDENSKGLKIIQDFLKPLPEQSTVPLGVPCVDDQIQGGLSGPGSTTKGKLIIVAARPAMGKTQFVCNLGLRMARQGYKVGLFSLEMGEEEIRARLAAGFDFLKCQEEQKWIGGKLKFSHITRRHMLNFPALKKRYEDNLPEHREITKRFFVFPDEVTYTAKSITDCMRSFARRHTDTRMFIIDHLGLMDHQAGNASTAKAIGNSVKLIKRTAKALGVDTILASQLNRGVEERANKMPQLSDIRDSGEIEEHADVVVGLYREAYYDPTEANKNDLDLNFMKNRQGLGGIERLCIDNDCCAVWEAPRVL